MATNGITLDEIPRTMNQQIKLLAEYATQLEASVQKQYEQKKESNEKILDLFKTELTTVIKELTLTEDDRKKLLEVIKTIKTSINKNNEFDDQEQIKSKLQTIRESELGNLGIDKVDTLEDDKQFERYRDEFAKSQDGDVSTIEEVEGLADSDDSGLDQRLPLSVIKQPVVPSGNLAIGTVKDGYRKTSNGRWEKVKVGGGTRRKRKTKRHRSKNRRTLR